ncbi:hypothetical protein C8C83_4504 [Flavobacterium sp. 90]|nr:hypothetical protein C8C82_4845 [Flavobacterium sp. 81]TCK56487.1 hypothetical protein C8C83_4504 [Flavobacterium sp. 90]
MISIYPLEWLDSLILFTFNPKKTNVKMLSKNDLYLISENVLKESQKVQIQLKKEVFSLHKKRQIRLLVRKYHSTLIFLLDNIIENQQHEMLKSSAVLKIVDLIISSLDELLSFVENRYSNYLSLDERVPVTYLIVSRKELFLKLERLKKRKIGDSSNHQVMEIIIDVFSKTIQSNTGHKITYRQIFYQKELLKSLEIFVETSGSPNFYSGLHEVLIGQNFNCLKYINHLIDQISIELNSQDDLKDKMNKLLFYYKEFSQLLSNEKVTFDPSQQNIKYVLENWFKHEIAYLERKIELSLECEGTISGFQMNKENKIECILSTDQMALILRAGDESRILKAKSMSHVFKTIVPHLSTSQKKDLSYNAMRSKSYVAEERDKEIAIKTLERIIKHIKEY